MNQKLIEVIYRWAWKRSNWFRYHYYHERSHGGFVVPVLQSEGIYNFDSEPEMEWVLNQLLPDTDGAFVDVGVNTGQTLLLLKKLAPQVEYLGFEIQHDCIGYLNKLVRINKFINTTILPVGLGKERQTAFIYSNGNTDSGATLKPELRNRSYINRTACVIETGDFLLKKVTDAPISIIKIDVEGGELDVLLGMDDTIDQHRPYLIVEVLANEPRGTKDVEDAFFEYSPEGKLEFIKRWDDFCNRKNYRVFNLLADGLKMRRCFANEATESGTNNFLLVPSEHAEKISSKYGS